MSGLVLLSLSANKLFKDSQRKNKYCKPIEQEALKQNRSVIYLFHSFSPLWARKQFYEQHLH